MPLLVKPGASEVDNWRVIDTGEEISTVSDIPEHCLLPLEKYIELAPELTDKHGVWLTSDADIEILASHLSNLAVIACKFDTFVDGRSFSQARMLREHYDFNGEIRAIGSFIQDQLFYLLRCGFSQFSVADDVDLESMQESFADFTETYQAACDISQPLFRRRA